LIDKIHEVIVLFEDGKPVLNGAVLTGESLADRLPSNLLAKAFTGQTPIGEKVTPAGRYTVTQKPDRELGRVLEINEIQGKDWAIAIHQVYLGIPSEHRAARLNSPEELDRHITFGCINVDRDTMRQLLAQLPKKGKTPLYIMPQNETMTDTFFPPHTPAFGQSGFADERPLSHNQRISPTEPAFSD
jgi:L,D-transpeptidase catalytic domain